MKKIWRKILEILKIWRKILEILRVRESEKRIISRRLKELK